MRPCVQETHRRYGQELFIGDVISAISFVVICEKVIILFTVKELLQDAKCEQPATTDHEG